MNAKRRQPDPPTSNAKPRRFGGIAALTLFLALLAYAATGFYFVQPDERGVVRWFGRVPESQLSRPYGVGPGLHYAAPWPICRVDTPKTKEVRRVIVGMTPELREAIAAGETWAMTASPETDMFTGDVNILKVAMAVQFQVDNPIANLLAVNDPDKVVRSTVQSVLIEELSRIPVDQALTAAKAMLENTTQERAQGLLNDLNCGVHLIATNLESIEPPRAIVSAFQEVVSAKKDGERAVDRAVADTNRILPRARGDAARMLQEAGAYREVRVSRARGDTDAFLKLLAEYERSPEVTADRLRLQAFERVLSKVRKIVVDNKPGETPTRLRIIDERPE